MVISATHLRLPVAVLGPDSPLPAFSGLQRLPDSSISLGLSRDMRRRVEYGRLSSPLPYPVQSGYGRERVLSSVPAISLVNDRVEAVVLPQYGGRVWSLRHLSSGRDLLHRNPVLSFANLGLTGAWFAGGVEWNLGSTGHSATTSRPLFAAAVDSPAGPILRLWEWERTRDLIFSVDLSLPSGSDFLYASVRVSNPDPAVKPLYWWTNLAVSETPDVRVLAPAARAWRTTYDGRMATVGLPHPDAAGPDISYSGRADHPVDYFFQIDDSRRAWIAAVGADGQGVVHTSTARLRGRKLFCWGAGTSGSRWQEWLSGQDSRYLEIQAGLATTQLEHLRLDAGGQISWTEAIGPISVDPALAHAEWDAAGDAAAAALAAAVPEEQLDEVHRRWLRDTADLAPAELMHRGSGFGLAELRLRDKPGDHFRATPFTSPVSDGASHLLALLSGRGVDPERAARELPIPPVTDAWQPWFESAPGSWWASLMLAIRAHAAGDLDNARHRYQESLTLRPSALARRGLALISSADGDQDTAATGYRAAVALDPGCWPLLAEATDALLRAGRAVECLEMIADAPPEVAGHGRLVLLRVRALLAVGDQSAAARLLQSGFDVADLREGESLEEVWRLACPEIPLPRRYDFAMR